MRVLKLFVLALFTTTLVAALVQTRIVRSQGGPTEAPAAFDNMTNGFEPQGSPVQPNTTPTPATFETDKFLFSKVDEITPDGLGPVYNAQSCRECHQNPVTGGISQIFELRGGHNAPDGTFVDAPGGSLIHSRAIDALIQERVPDGSRIISSKNGSQMFIMGFDGGQYGDVALGPGGVSFAAFSPDARKIIFSTGVNGIRQIFVMNVDGTNQTQLTNDPSGAFHAVWSPDGTTIAFVSSRSAGSQIWAMNPDGTNQRNLTNDGIGGNDSPAWSPNSQKIAFQRLRNSAQTDVWSMNADGTGQTNLTNTTGFNFNGDPSWSPDGTMIAFGSSRDNNFEIYKMTSSGGSQTRLTTNSANDGAPAWSPDGNLIAFNSTRSGGSFRIFIMATDGSNQTLLVKQGFASYSSPQWSPDATGENIRSFRASLNVLGDGFVEATDDSMLLTIQANQPVDMRGTAIYVNSLEAPNDPPRIGRFGWKDQLASLLSFSSDAYLNEMGITNRFNLMENSSLGRSVATFDPVPDTRPCASDMNVNCGEDDGEDIQAFARFMRSTKAPPRDRNLVAVDSTDSGSALFDSLSCSVCHTRNITTTSNPATTFNGGTFTVGALANKTFHPFGDFLLHDIGTGDGIAQAGGETTRNMVRTAPLWGVRTRDRLMHDGGSSSAPSNSGAQSFTFNEAILRHAGQANASRIAFQALSPVDKARLFKFLKSL
jgi:Tol biopolymer transport system component/CxxC motif-containing protein (DUF1111 family)